MAHMPPIIFQERPISDNSTSSSMSCRSHSHASHHSPQEPSSVPSLDRNDSVDSKFADSEVFTDPRASVETYCTTVVSFEDEDEDEKESDEAYEPIILQSDATPATPQEFASLFPSTKRLSIKHDDSTLDGNMNLRVDASKGEHGRRLTLFHLRMYDLKDRDFAFRRYGRDCGREVARIKRKFAKPSTQRPALQRSVSKALHSFRGKHEEGPAFGGLNRQDSGYSSGGFDEDEDEDEMRSGASSPKPTNACMLEFSNYAHVELVRRGGKSSKKYDFEYWGKSYSWKRVLGSHEDDTTYHLVNNSTHNVVATIEPDILTPAMVAAEEAKGGFVPPCTLVLKDSAQDPVNPSMADTADVIVATGINALVDDCIKRKFHKKRTMQLTLPVPGHLKMNMEYVGPRKLIDEMFSRRPALSRSQSSQHMSNGHQRSQSGGSSRSTTPMPPPRTRTG